MVEGTRAPQLTAAQKIAKRFSEKRGLKPPIEVRELLEDCAEVEDVVFPVEGVDAVCLFLKDPTRKPKVLIRKGKHPLRKRFTEAHELGHITIPWHMGGVIDESDYILAVDDMESEANQFAAELLIPSWFVQDCLDKLDDLSKAHVKISADCNVSLQAAAIKLLDHLPPNMIFAVSSEGVVEFAGKSVGTYASPFRKGDSVDSVDLSYAQSSYSESYRSKDIRWWVLPREILIISSDNRPWREILEDIVKDIDVGDVTEHKFKGQANGVVAAANSAIKRNNDYSVAALVATCKQRFANREDMREFCRHAKFDEFLLKKAEELVSHVLKK